MLMEACLRILVTGARGFIGSFLVAELLKKKHNVRCLLRPGRGGGWLQGLDYENIPGDITQPATLPQAVEGVDLVYHLAGCTKALNRAQFDQRREGKKSSN